MKYYLIWFVTAILILICISAGYYYTVFERKKENPSVQSKPADDPLLKLNQQLMDIEISKHFWENKIKLSDMDYYNLFINLSDRLVSLETSGITVHDAKIFNFEIAENIQSFRDKKDIVMLLSEPLKLQDEWASIQKDPIRIKDISGYQWDPDSLNFVPTEIDTEFVFVVLKYSKNISIMISQRAIVGKMPSYIKADPMSRFEYIMNKNMEKNKMPFSPLLQKNWIGIEIPRSDAITIFRALKEKSLLVLCL